MSDQPDAPKSPPNFELVRRLARLVRLAADRPSAMPEQRAQVNQVVAAAKSGAARIAPGPEGVLLVDDVAMVDADDDARLLAERLAAYGVEELTVTPRAAAADLFDLGRLLGNAPTGEDPVGRFAAGATVIDSRSIMRRMKARAPALASDVVDDAPTAVPRRPSRIETPRSSAAMRAAARTPVGTPGGTPIVMPAVPPPPPDESEKLREPPPVPSPSHPGLALTLGTLGGSLELRELQGALDEIVAFADLAFRSGRSDDLIEAMAGLISVEWAQLERDSADARRQAFAHAVRRLAKPVMLRKLAALRHQRSDDPVAVARLQAVLDRYGTDGANALIDEYANAPTAEARKTCLDALRGLRRAHDALFALARDVEPHVVRLAAMILGDLGEPRGEELLVEMLQHTDANARRSAVAALSRFPGDRALEALGVALRDEAAPVRARAVAGLIARRDLRAVPLLAPLLDREDDREVLYSAIEGLGALGGAEAVQLLIRCAQGEGEHPLRRTAAYRIHACTALVTIRTPQAMAGVQMLRDDRDREVRDASMRLVAQAQRRTTQSVPVVSAP